MTAIKDPPGVIVLPAGFIPHVEPAPTLLTAEDVAPMLGVHLNRIYDMVRLGQIPYLRIGKKLLRFPEPAIRRMLAEGNNWKEDKTNVVPQP